jgi:ornithine decarboxylase
LVAEPGRVLVAEAGVLVSTVIGTARRYGRKWVHLDVGAFNGMMESLETHNTLRFPVTDSLRSDDVELCHLTGPSCDGQDTILYDVPLSKGLAAGDRVFIGNAGSYTTSYASTFNGFSLPSTCFV